MPPHDLIGWVPSAPDGRIASVRLRCLLPCRQLRDAGWNTELFDPRRANDYRAVIFQKAYDERALRLVTELRGRGVVTAVDLCDNHFYNPDRSPELARRAERLGRMLELVDAVSVSTAPLAELVADRDPVLIDDALDDPPSSGRVRAFRARRRKSSGTLRLVWYGHAGSESPAFGLVHLPRIAPVLNTLAREAPIELTVITNARERFERATSEMDFSCRFVEWGWRSFASNFRQHDVCVIPIEQNPFTVCKTGNRIALSLKLGVSVVADSIPSFEPFRDYVRLDDWDCGLRAYLDSAVRTTDAERGRRYVEATYTPNRVVAEWGDFLEGLLG